MLGGANGVMTHEKRNSFAELSQNQGSVDKQGPRTQCFGKLNQKGPTSNHTKSTTSAHDPHNKASSNSQAKHNFEVKDDSFNPAVQRPQLGKGHSNSHMEMDDEEDSDDV